MLNMISLKSGLYLLARLLTKLSYFIVRTGYGEEAGTILARLLPNVWTRLTGFT
jgi:hypothetical protein